jgi:hypothetical protein
MVITLCLILLLPTAVAAAELTQAVILVKMVAQVAVATQIPPLLLVVLLLKHQAQVLQDMETLAELVEITEFCIQAAVAAVLVLLAEMLLHNQLVAQAVTVLTLGHLGHQQQELV